MMPPETVTALAAPPRATHALTARATRNAAAALVDYGVRLGTTLAITPTLLRVLGATGFVGRQVVPLLLAAGCRVTAISRDPARVRSLPGGSAMGVIEADPFAADVRFPRQPGAVLVHLAWPHLDDYRNPAHFLEALPASRRLILAAVAAGVAGGLFAYAKGSVFPTYMAIPRSVDALLMVLLGGVSIFGGTGTLTGVGLSVLIIGTGEAKAPAGLKVEYAPPSADQAEVRSKILRLVRGGAESPKAA